MTDKKIKFVLKNGLARKVIAEILILLLLVVVLVYGFSFTQQYRARIAAKQVVLASEPETLLRRAALLRELESQQEKLADFKESVPDSDSVGVFIGYLEKLSGEEKVILKVPEIAEEVLRNEQGLPMPWSGPFKEAKLKITATGEPLALLNFLDKIERSPYLVTIREWSVRGAVKVSGSALMSVPVKVDDEERDAGGKVSSILDAQLILTIANDGQ